MKLPPFLFCAVFAAGTMFLTAQEKRPVISFDNTVKNAGKVLEGETIKHVFKFTNKGDATLEIYKVEPS